MEQRIFPPLKELMNLVGIGNVSVLVTTCFRPRPARPIAPASTLGDILRPGSAAYSQFTASFCLERKRRVPSPSRGREGQDGGGGPDCTHSTPSPPSPST